MYFSHTWTLVTTFFWFSPLVSAKMLSSTPTNLSSMIFVIIFWWKSYKDRRCSNDVKLKVSMNNLFLYPFDLLKFSFVLQYHKNKSLIYFQRKKIKPTYINYIPFQQLLSIPHLEHHLLLCLTLPSPCHWWWGKCTGL